MSKQPSLSIIIPTFNSEESVGLSLKSIVSQSFKDYEVWIIDGKSTDNTLNVIQEFSAQGVSIHSISEPDNGIYDAMNKGITLARGEWLYFLGSDDVLADPDVLYKIFKGSNNLQCYDVIYGNVIFKHSQTIYDGEFNCYKLLSKNICHQSIFYRRKLFDIIGYFSPKYKMLADWHSNMKWFNHKKIRNKYVDILVAIYNEDGSCFNIPDSEFKKDWEKNIKQYFPFHTIFLYNNRNSKYFRKIANICLR